MRAARLAGWAGAAMLVLGGHGAAALWVMHTRTYPPPPAGQPIFVDLAPPPPAPDFAVPESGLALSGPPIIQPAPPLPDFALPPSPLEPPPPLTEIAKAAPPEIEMPPIESLPAFDAAALLPTVSAERPARRPAARPEPPRESAPAPTKPRKAANAEKRPLPQKAESAPAGNRANRLEAAARPAAQASGAGKSAGAKAQASWRATASAAVARHMQRGRYNTAGPVTATISLTVDGSGQIISASASSDSGGALTAALTRQIRHLRRLPAPPSGSPLSAVVPVKIMR